jgi:hypothetical protein
MLNRSKSLIDVEPFICAQTFRIHAAQLHAVPRSPEDDHVNYQQSLLSHAPHRTTPFPNGDVGPRCAPVEPPASEKPA